MLPLLLLRTNGKAWWLFNDFTNKVPYNYLRASDMSNDDGATAPAGSYLYL
jgi:hypothetical protein